jgi:hypothetical protein
MCSSTDNDDVTVCTQPGVNLYAYVRVPAFGRADHDQEPESFTLRAPRVVDSRTTRALNDVATRPMSTIDRVVEVRWTRYIAYLDLDARVYGSRVCRRVMPMMASAGIPTSPATR